LSGEKRRHSDGPVLVSACLLGLPTRYDGGACPRPEVQEALRGLHAIPICPEQLGGLPTPRVPAQIRDGDGTDVLDGRAQVVRRDGGDVTENYLRGAHHAAALAEMFSARRAILKEGSPACGTGRIKRGEQDVDGMGVAAALLKRKGVELEGIE